MSTELQPTSTNDPAFEFKSGVVTIPVLNIFSTDIPVITQQLREKIKQAPEFFTHSSVLIDLQLVSEKALNLSLLVDGIRNAGMFPVGVRGGSEEQQQVATDLMLPTLSIQNTNNLQPKAHTQLTPTVTRQAELTTTADSLLVTQPIRSGQRIYTQGDLIVIATVSAGAEIMAEGNIHIYGSLRGRALAGVQGNENARIFCTDLQAELISIAGNYRISEDIDQTIRNTPVQIYLNKQALLIKNI